jgi:eukaryotic-like serine/threonine-protein kinase
MGGTPTGAGDEAASLGQPRSAPGETLADDSSAGSLLREVARIEDAALPADELVRPGDLLGAYRIVRRLGKGAMGVVYEAADQQLSRRVALKVLSPSRAGDDARRRRFRREAHAASAVVHPSVAAVYGAGHERGLDYLAMEYVAGVTLGEAMRRRGGSLELAEAARIGEAVASGVGRAHELGIVHRDLKPENVMIAEDGAVKVLDFGLAKLAAPPEGAGGSQLVTLEGHIVGTPAYMSPEQAKGRPVDARSDVFALGVMLYELVTGRRPFRGETTVDLFIAIDRDEPPRPSAVNAQVSPALEAIVLRCLRKAPEDRYGSCGEAAAALRRLASGDAPALAAAVTSAELRLASVVRVTLPPGDPSVGADAEAVAVAAAVAQERAALTALLAGYGADTSTLASGALVATFSQRPTGAGAATDLAVQAARCALAARDAVPGAAIAIATGRALVAGSTPVGEAADRAAALAIEASGAAILLDELTAGLLDGRCRVGARGGGVFALEKATLAADATRPLLGRPTPCVGRDAELAMLDAALGACRDEAAPRAVLVVAPPGQGKTRLLHEWLRRMEARTDPPQVLLGRGDPVRGAAGGLLAQALRPALDVAEGMSPDAARVALLAAVSRLAPAADAPWVAELLGELCGVRFPDEGRAQLGAARRDPLAMAEQLERAWLAWLGAMCRARPVVLVLEDLQWGDARTVALVEAALRELTLTPTDGALLVLALARPEVDERFPNLWAGRAHELALGPLGRKASERLVRSALGAEADRARIERIVQLSEGNALFLEELVRAAVEGRGDEVPGTLLAMLQARIERLLPEERRVLRVASVLGERFGGGDVGALLGADDRELAGWLRGLLSREVLAVERGPVSEASPSEHRFRHALVREAAYGTLPDPERRALHLAAAEHLVRTAAEPAVVAEHFERGGSPARAAGFYRDAALRALQRLEHQDSIRWARRGLACGAEGQTRGQLLAIDANACSASNIFDDNVLASALEAMMLVPPGSWPFCVSLGFALTATLVWAPASERARTPALVATLLATEPDPEARLAYVCMLAMVLTHLCATTPRGQLEPLFARLREVCDRFAAAEPTARLWLAAASSHAAWLFEHAPWRALEAAESCLRDARLLGDRQIEHWILVCGHDLKAWQLGDTAAEDRLRAHLQGAVHPRSTALQAMSAIGLARIACDTGDPAALAQGAWLMRLIAEDPRANAYASGVAYEHWARIELREGRPAAALAARGRAALSHAPLLGLGATATLARALAAEGQVADAVRVADEALAVVAALGGAGALEVEVRLAASEASTAAGDGARARAELRGALDLIRTRAEDIEDLGRRRGYLTRNADICRARALAAVCGIEDPTAALLSGA